MNTNLLATSLSLLALGSLLPAQSYWVSPPNAANQAGGTNNTIPLWSTSATYQQFHDAPSMGKALAIKGLSVRMSGTFSGAGRACDMTLQMSQTAVTSGTATGTFASNLGTVNNAYVFGTASTFMNFSWLSAAGTGPVNPPAFTIPFSATYNYIAPIGNLVWEWRFKNATANTSVPLDAASGSGANLGTLLPSSGTGCTATGKTGPATGTLTTPLVGGDYHLQFDLNNAANSVSAILALGVSNTTSPVGWCAPVISPLVLLPGTTDSNGAWSFSSPLVGLAGSAPFSLFAQYGFDNSGSIGLSDVDGYTSGPIPGALGLTRIYRAAAFSTQTGDELATTGSLGRRYGLVVSWLQ